MKGTIVLSAADVLAQSSGGSNLTFIIMIVGFIALMYFVMIRPQKKRQKEQQNMQNTVAPGARVMTIGGLYGTVVDSDDESVTLEASDDNFLVFARQAIAKVVTPASRPRSSRPEADRRRRSTPPSLTRTSTSSAPPTTRPATTRRTSTPGSPTARSTRRLSPLSAPVLE